MAVAISLCIYDIICFVRQYEHFKYNSDDFVYNCNKVCNVISSLEEGDVWRLAVVVVGLFLERGGESGDEAVEVGVV